MDARAHSVLRFAFGVTFAFVLAELAAWTPTFLPPVFVGSRLGTLVFAATRLLAGALHPEPAGHGPLRLRARGLESAGFLVGGEGAGLQDQIPFGSFLAMGAAI